MKRFVEFVGSKSAKLNDSVSPMDHKLRLHKDSAVHIRFKQDPVATVKGKEKVEHGTPYCVKS